MKVFLIILFIILGLIVLYLFLSFCVYIAIFESPNPHQKRYDDYPDDPLFKGSYEKVKDLIATLKKEPCEDVYIKSYDKLTLRGRYYHQNDNAPLAICAHGYRGTPIRDFCGGYQVLKEQGFNILLIDHRAHLKSKGHTITFGIKESKDVMSWIKYANQRFGNDKKIVLVGISMGAYTVSNVIINEKIPDNVICAIADCPYHSPKAMVKHSCIHDVHIPWFVGGPLLFTGALIFGHFNLFKKDFDLTNKKAQRDILIIHGDIDNIVPCKFSENIDHVQREIFEGADHGLSYVVDPIRYKKISSEFVRDHLK